MKEGHIKNILKKKFKKSLNNVQIFEEGIDIQTQIDFEKYSKRFLKKEVSEINIDDIQEKLQNESVSTEEKKNYLVELSFSDNVKSYRLIENYRDSCSEELKNWATLSAQKSRAHIEHSLSNDDKIYISSGLGGSGNKLRYFFVLSASDNADFSGFHQEILKKEIEYTLKKYGGVAESTTFYNYFVTIVCLIPINVSLENVFQHILDECNQFGNFLSDKIIATNTELFKEETIMKILNDDPEIFNDLAEFDEVDTEFKDMEEFDEDEFGEDDFDDEFDDDEDFDDDGEFDDDEDDEDDDDEDDDDDEFL
jgi:hypothetical protein